MLKPLATATTLALAASLVAGQDASVSVVSSDANAAPGGSFTVTLDASFDTGGAGGGLFGDAGFYGFGGVVGATGDGAGGLAAGVPTLSGELAFAPVAAAGTGATLATGAAGRGLAGGLATAGDLMSFTVNVDPGAADGEVTLGFSGAVVLVQGDSLVTYSTDPGPNQQPLTVIPVTVTIGVAGCNPADLAEPFGVLDLSDINAFVSAFAGQQPDADLDGNGIYDLSDITLFVGAFTGGCP